MSDDARLRIAVVGAGRLGTAITKALRGHPTLSLAGPFGRGFTGRLPGEPDADVVLLCVPDREIASAAAAVVPGPLVGHCSGATSLAALAPHEGFTLHPLMTVRGDRAGELDGAGCTISGTTSRAKHTAYAIATAVGLAPFTIAEEDRAAYHAAASFAANFLVTVEASAERLLADTGVPRDALAPLVRAAVANWATLGPRDALTGPVARGDEETVDAQRQAVRERAPELLRLFDALVERTRALATQPEEVAG